MRQFYLQDEYGQKAAFQGGDIFLWEPGGLGFDDAAAYEPSGNYFVRTDYKAVQQPITGTLIFMPGEQYDNYFDFMNWIYAAKELKLAYKPAAQWYFIDVDLTSAEKSEINELNLLEIPVKLLPKTPWYLEQQLKVYINGELSDNVKRYAYAYPYRYSNTNKAGAVSFTLDAQLPSGFYLTIDGAAFNPVITATDESTGDIIGKIDLSAMSVEEGQRLIFSTLPDTAGAFLVTGEGTQDLTPFLGLDSDYPTFFDIPPRVPVEFAISAQTPKGLAATLTVNRYYRTV